MTRILWISRHQLTQEQIDGLKIAFGNDIKISTFKDTISNIEDIKSHIKNVDVIAAVVPADMLPALLDAAEGRPVIKSVAERIPTGRKKTLPDGMTEYEYEFKHCYWEQIESVKIVTKKL